MLIKNIKAHMYAIPTEHRTTNILQLKILQMINLKLITMPLTLMIIVNIQISHSTLATENPANNGSVRFCQCHRMRRS